jgi:hypothetical protein
MSRIQIDTNEIERERNILLVGKCGAQAHFAKDEVRIAVAVAGLHAAGIVRDICPLKSMCSDVYVIHMQTGY